MEQKKLAIIATKGTLDWVYPPLILASTAAALGYEVQIFCTFYGLQLLKKDVGSLQVSPIGNPGMPMKMPYGPEWLQNIDMKIPNIIQTNLPGYEAMASSMMKKTIEKNGVASVPELRELCQEADVKFIACQMTVDLFGFDAENDFIEDIDFAGAASFFEFAGNTDICLYI